MLKIAASHPSEAGRVEARNSLIGLEHMTESQMESLRNKLEQRVSKKE